MSARLRIVRVTAGLVGLSLIAWVWAFGGPEVAFWIALGLNGVLIFGFLPYDLRRDRERQAARAKDHRGEASPR
jgi:fatty acid desaturase